MRRAIVLVALALGGPAVAEGNTSVERACYASWKPADVELALGVFSAERLWVRHEDAHAAGIPWGFEVYGTTLEPGQQFDELRRTKWIAAFKATIDRDGYDIPCVATFGTEVIARGALLVLTPDTPRTSFALNVEQDSVIPPASDKDYTMGVAFQWSGGWVNRSWISRGFRHIDPGGRLHEGFGESFRFEFGDSAFAPLKVNLGRTDPIADDRPYANLLYASVRRESADKLGVLADRATVTELVVGVLGLGIGKSVQTAIHKAADDTIPGGWDNQISNGGEPTARYRIAKRWRLPVLKKRQGWGVDANGGIEGNAGFYTNASAGGRLRFGKIHSQWYSYDRVSAATYRADAKRKTPFELFAFGSGGYTLWFYNELLQGGFRDSAVTLAHGSGQAPLRRGMWDWQVGGTLRWRFLNLSLTESHHTALFDGPNSRDHRWRTLAVAF